MDIQEIHKWHDVFLSDREIFEVRLLGGSSKKVSVSGYFKDVDVMISQLSTLVENDTQRNNFQVYFTLNELPEAIYNREQHDKFLWGAETTKDNDIVRRKWVFVDFDSKRPKGVSASNEEVAAAKKKLAEVYKFLKEEGFHEPVMAFSGNGYHLLLKADMPNDNGHKEIVKAFIDIISSKFSDGKVEIDKAVFNAARICKLYGTEARKGLSTTERPWRMSKIEYVPKVLEVNNEAIFKSFVDKYSPKRETKQSQWNRYNGYGHFDLERWFADHGVEYRNAGMEGGMQKYQLRHCGWEESHSESHEWTDAAIFVMPDGKIIYKCFHDHCQGRTWPEFRKLYEPDYDPNNRDKYWNNAQTVIIQQPARPKPQPDIKPEDEERGKKWLSPLEIEKINLYDLPKVQTGFRELDRAIKGLHFFEYTILSGTNGCGKSSWLNTLILNVIQRGTKVALWSGELPSYSLQTWIDMAAAGKHVQTGHDREGEPYYFVPDGTSRKIRTWLDGKLVIYNGNYGQKWEQLSNDIKGLISQGFRFFVLDNLTSMDLDIIEGTKNEKERTVVENLHDFCIHNQCHIILVVHPRKGTARGQRNLLRKDDVAGTGTITNLADNVLIIHRNNEDFRKGIAEFYGKDEAAKYDVGGEYEGVGNVIEICKNRMFGNQDRLVRLYFDSMSRRFKNSPDENIEYGWNEGAVAKMGNLNLDNNQTSDDLPFGQATDEAPF